MEKRKNPECNRAATKITVRQRETWLIRVCDQIYCGSPTTVSYTQRCSLCEPLYLLDTTF